jgi:hypothetical protein
VRERLPQRRECEGFDVEALRLRFHATVGRYDDGRVAEVFITNHKAGSMAGILTSDSAVLCSIALQRCNVPPRFLDRIGTTAACS